MLSVRLASRASTPAVCLGLHAARGLCRGAGSVTGVRRCDCEHEAPEEKPEVPAEDVPTQRVPIFGASVTPASASAPAITSTPPYSASATPPTVSSRTAVRGGRRPVSPPRMSASAPAVSLSATVTASPISAAADRSRARPLDLPAYGVESQRAAEQPEGRYRR